MSEIQILPSDVIDQIAAGEVIERPAQMIKELVENSFDAGATRILIDFAEGGRSVRITDNGKGIAKEDLARALERFATSKIAAADDLWKLKTFGFRGEALASIASVSELTLISRTAQDQEASKLISKYGQKKIVDAVASEPGTTLVIDKLFENVPARLKFLKSAASEATQIKNMLKAMALSHPEVEIKVLNSGELIYFWPAVASRLERAKQVLELPDLYEGTAEREDMKAYSVFADPNSTAKTSRSMWFFVQGRWVQDRGLQAAVQEAYRHLLMHGEYPISMTWIETDPEKVDVNIHPTKSQIKFLEPSLAFRATQASVRDTLEKAPWIKQAVETYSQRELVETRPAQNLSFRDRHFERTQYQVKIEPQQSSVVVGSGEPEAQRGETGFAPEAQAGAQQGGAEPGSAASSYWANLQILGQADLTYIVTQTRTGLVFVDQHAAHERVMFEKLMHAWRQNTLLEVQEFLFPLTLDFSTEQVDMLLSQVEGFARLGVGIERMGPSTIGVTSAPHILKESALFAVLEKTAQEMIDYGGSYSFENSLSHICSTMACHSAVRAGQALSQAEMKSLLENMDEFPLSGFCPHGRPVQVEYAFNQLERDFGRIV